MTVVQLTATLALGSFGAGFLGALTGLGGGVILVPLMTLGLKVNLYYAIGTSLVSVIATSSGAAAAYVREGFSHIRIGMFLEMATTFGAVLGASLTAVISPSKTGFIFGLVLLYSAWQSIRGHRGAVRDAPGTGDRLARKLKMYGSWPAPGGQQAYCARRVPLGFSLMFGAGFLSGLLGIGSGAAKVIAMDQAMELPFKVSTTTSNFMIGVTAAAGAGVYFRHGYIDPGLTMPVVLGVLLGSIAGARFLSGAKTALLRRIFAGVILLLAVEMLRSSLTGGLR